MTILGGIMMINRLGDTTAPYFLTKVAVRRGFSQLPLVRDYLSKKIEWWYFLTIQKWHMKHTKNWSNETNQCHEQSNYITNHLESFYTTPKLGYTQVITPVRMVYYWVYHLTYYCQFITTLDQHEPLSMIITTIHEPFLTMKITTTKQKRKRRAFITIHQYHTHY